MDVELAEVRDFLAQHAPFADLPAPVLAALPAKLTARYFRRGSTLVAAGQPNTTMFVLRSGAVDIIDAHGSLVERSDVGTCFGMSSVISGGPSSFTMTAREDSLTLLMPGEVFHDLIRTQPAFARFFMQQQAGRIRSAVESVQVSDSGGAILKTRVGEIVRRSPVTTGPGTSIRDAAVAMSEARVSAILVTDGSPGRLLGIVTDRDLRTKVIAAGLSPDEPVSAVMTSDPQTVAADALAFEVLMEMTQRGFHHLPVVDEAAGRDPKDAPDAADASASEPGPGPASGRESGPARASGHVIGMITAGDLMRLQQANPVYLVGDIAHQTDVDGLARSASRLAAVVESYVAQDASAADIGRLVTVVGDALTRRLLNFAEAEFGTPPTRYCWVALGSQARLELGLGSDQDSALILSDDHRPEHDDYVAALAERVVGGLEACGFPRCPGDMMASNPRWRVPITPWSRYFASWVNEPDPDALLNAQTFFDMRPVYGDNALFARLQSAVIARTPQSARFLAHLAKQANDWQPPIGFFRGFVLEHGGEHRDTLDLKAGGLVAVVQMARLLALSRGLPQVNTLARLRAAASVGALSAENAENLADAFEFISYLRLRHQAEQARNGVRPDNHLAPAELTDFEKRSLRDAFGIVRRMQGALAHSYQTHVLS